VAQRSAARAGRSAPRRRAPSRAEAARIRARHRRRRLIAAVVLLVLAVVAWRAFASDGGGKPAASSTGGGSTAATGAGATSATTGAGASSAATTAAKPVAADPERRLTPGTLKAIPRNVAVLRASHATKKVALTFDDGPSEYTAQVLKVLEDNGVKATFFVLGQHVKERPQTIRAELAAGHVVGDHTWSHPDLTTLSPADRKSQLSDTVVQIKAVASGYRPDIMRPPYGGTNPTINLAARKLGLVPVLWSDDSEDWQAGQTAGMIAKRVLEGVAPGSIILLHDGGGDRSATVDALPVIIQALRNRGLEPVTVPELLNTARPTAADKSFLLAEGGPSGQA
jgi:peptidoglycan/xylan/chitin deacetylase (PgdA/CDA1 family)